MYRRKNVVITVMCMFVLFMAIGYAAFSTILNINGTASIESEWNVKFTNITTGTAVGKATNEEAPSYTDTTATMNVNLELPGDSMTYELTLTNSGTLDAIINNVTAEATGSAAIIYSISGIKIGDKLAAKEDITIIIKIEYDPNVTSQPSETSKTLTVNISAVQDTGQTITSNDTVIEQPLLLRSKILNDNTAQADTGINFSAGASSTNGQGLYYTSANTEDSKTTYYFRGNVTNNYVSFAGQTWRIVRINEDGSVRLIRQAGISTSEYGGNNGDNAYVGYMYGTTGSSTYALTHANNNNSAIKTYLKDWYNTYLSSYSSYIADAGFCNDRSINSGTGIGTTFTLYGFAGRNNAPQFACSQSNDLFTTSTSTKGNKVLTNPIGLLSADEAVYAGAFNPPGETYLANGESFWTMSPYSYDPDSGNSAWVYVVQGNGHLYYYTITDTSIYVRPVINLRADVEISTGDGTSGTPYVIKTS